MYTVNMGFVDLQDSNHSYAAGDTYPRQGLKPTKERTAELSGAGNGRKIPLIKEVKEAEQAAPKKKAAAKKE